MSDPDPLDATKSVPVDVTKSAPAEQQDGGRPTPVGPRRSVKLAGIMSNAFRMVWTANPRLLVATVALKLASGVCLAAALIFGQKLIAAVLREGLGANAWAAVLPRLAVVVGIITLLGMLAVVGREVREVMTETTVRHIKESIIGVTANVELSAFETPSFHDGLMRAVSSDYRPIQMVDGLFRTVGAMFGIAGIVVTLTVIQPWLVPVLLVAGLPLLFGVIKAGRALFNFYLQMTSTIRVRNHVYRLLTEKDPAKEVRAFGLREHLTDRHARLYDRHMSELRAAVRKRLRVGIVAMLSLSVALGAGLAGLLALTLSGRLDLPQTAAATGALLLLGERIMATNIGVGIMYEAGLFIEDLTAFLATAPQPQTGNKEEPAPDGFARISVEDVTFTYPAADTPALRGISLQIKAGQVIALVGENGSGKTTLAKLLCRLYLPDSGTIAWDGADTAGFDAHQLRRRIAVIFQDFARYQLTARENIGLGSLEHLDDLDRVIAAAQHAGADHYLQTLPSGYETILSPEYEGGRDLSVGQWQRVALARAFIRDAPLVILDEPTASLDPRAEHDLFSRIRALYKGRTVLLISHRFSTVRDADHIYVLDHGKIIEQGSHDHLMTAQGVYAHLFTLQAAAYLGGSATNGSGHHDVSKVSLS